MSKLQNLQPKCQKEEAQWKKLKLRLKYVHCVFQLFLSYMKWKCVSTATLFVRPPNEKKNKMSIDRWINKENHGTVLWDYY